MGLILAQGAEHTNQDRIAKIVLSMREAWKNVPELEEIDSKSISDILDHKDAQKVMQIEPYIDDKIMWYYADSLAFRSDYVAEEKFDGYSYLNVEGRFFSKRLSEKKGFEGTPVEKTGHMPHITNILKVIYERTGCDLHGELYVPGGISDDVTKILGCDEDKAIRRTMENYDKRLRYMLIDIRAYKGHILINEPYRVRRALLRHLYDTYIQPIDHEYNIQLAPILAGDPVQEFRDIVSNGGEGIIFKRTSALYIPGKKPADNWIKGKKKITLDVVIMGFNNNGTGKNESMFGSIEFGMYVDGKLKKMGNASSGVSDSIRAQLAADPDKYIGTVMEIESIQESVNSFRNAVFLRLRDDKDAIECIPLNIRVNKELVPGLMPMETIADCENNYDENDYLPWF